MKFYSYMSILLILNISTHNFAMLNNLRRLATTKPNIYTSLLISRCYTRAFSDSSAKMLPKKDANKDAQISFLRNARTHTIYALKNGQTVGQIETNPKDAGHITFFYLPFEHQNKGYERMLIQKASARASKFGKEKLMGYFPELTADIHRKLGAQLSVHEIEYELLTGISRPVYQVTYDLKQKN